MTPTQDDSQVKVVVALEKDADDYPPADSEHLWAVPVGEGLFRIDNIPFFAQSIALGDIVVASPEAGLLRFKEVVQPSGHSTVRIILYDEAETPKVIECFKQLGCAIERSQVPGLIALDVPPSISWTVIQRELEAGHAQERWDYEEACLGHLDERGLG